MPVSAPVLHVLTMLLPVFAVALPVLAAIVYILVVVLSSYIITSYFYRYGQSQGGSLLAANLCWPNNWVVLIGAFCSTIGAALQCLTSK